jgi:hypothetical protein
VSYSRDLTLTEAFAEYGAILGNHINEYSAIAKDGSVVIGCWERRIKRTAPGVWRYEVRDVLQWAAHGRNVLMEHLKYASSQSKPLRIVVVVPSGEIGEKIYDESVSGRNIPKSYHVRKDFVGQVVSLDENHFILDFKRT